MSTQSTTASPFGSNPPPPPPPFTQLTHAHHYISIKLTNDNHLHWYTQLEPFLSDHDLLGYVNGSIPYPPTHVPSSTGELLPNPAYTLWCCQDKLIMSLLISSMSEETMLLAVGKTSFLRNLGRCSYCSG
ncbi:hypothetical protein LIER_06702 [Lithospermum erythrorhizon]|uniref:Retrotransposon Copia-like N-terminal domain-containing protein n=1 Tax=Lithospermum erythrorhizon TaxID=34254 RepID=A0AAV3P5H1_LITER